ncbi:MAG: ATP-binding protein, partial [Candidatus Aminicenantes bacterium]|nr:ATP-binding protein [Candidatus Aminicenantes bacterium]
LNIEIYLKIIAEWVRGAEFPSLVPRELSIPDLTIRTRPILAVVGPRRAGKTYFLYQIIRDLQSKHGVSRDEILFVDFEDYRLRRVKPEDIEILLSAFYQLTGKTPRYIFFDEVQHIPLWSRVIRTLHNSRKYSIVVTGSNSTLLASEIATELRGRYEDCLVLPFSFREFLRFQQIDYSPAVLATPEVGLILRAFDDYLRFGGFPEVAGIKEESAKRRVLQSYFDTIFYKDIIDRHKIRARDLLDIVMRNLLESYASVFSVSAFEKQLKEYGISGSKRSIADYLRFLSEAFFLIVLEKFAFSPRKRMMNPKKVYTTDPGFCLLSGSFSENRGHLLENVVAIELFRRRQRFMYFQEKGECDFIIQEGPKVKEAWQVCWEINRFNEKRELSGLVEAWRKLNIKNGGILTYNQSGVRSFNGFKVQLIPVWRWLLSYQQD